MLRGSRALSKAGKAMRWLPFESSFARPGHRLRELTPKRVTVPALGASFHLEILRGDQGLRRLLPLWDDLLLRSAVRTPFMRADWLEIWSAIFSEDHDAWIGAAWHEDDTLAAVVPFAISPGQEGPRRHLNHLTFFGGLGEVVSEGQDLMALPGLEPVLDLLLDEVLAAVSGAWDLACFPYLDLDSPYLPALSAALARQGASCSLVNEQLSPCIRLDKPDWEGCLHQASSRFRQKLRKRRTAAEAAHQVTFRSIESPAEAVAALETLLRLHGERWSPEVSQFLQPRSRHFHHELVRRWCPRKLAWMHVLEFDGQPVAMDYLFADHDRVWDYQGGWSIALREFTPSYLLRVLGIQRAIATGKQDYDLLPGGEYKNDWTKQGRRVADLEAINPRSLKARAFTTVRAVKRGLTDLISKRDD